MIQSILRTEIRTETDIIHVRQKARQIAEYLKFDNQDKIRIATAISEIARNIFQYAKEGTITFSVAQSSSLVKFIMVAADKGPEISEIQEILKGSYVSPNGMGVGLIGARRLVDEMNIETGPDKGTVISMSKFIRQRKDILSNAELTELTNMLMSQKDPPEISQSSFTLQLDLNQKKSSIFSRSR